MNYAQNHDSASVFGLLTMPNVLQTSGAANATNVQPRLTINHLVGGDRMAHKAFNARGDSAQDFTDPVISAARIINDAAALDRALAARKALRPKRSDAAKRGWEARRG